MFLVLLFVVFVSPAADIWTEGRERPEQADTQIEISVIKMNGLTNVSVTVLLYPWMHDTEIIIRVKQTSKYLVTTQLF